MFLVLRDEIIFRGIEKVHSTLMKGTWKSFNQLLGGLSQCMCSRMAFLRSALCPPPRVAAFDGQLYLNSITGRARHSIVCCRYCWAVVSAGRWAHAACPIPACVSVAGSQVCSLCLAAQAFLLSHCDSELKPVSLLLFF